MKKVAKLFFVVLFFFFISINKIYAFDAIVSSSVNIRTGPSTGYGTRGILSAGNIISVMETISASNSGCSTGLWYKYIYNNETSYSCSANFDTTNRYNRPWTTPGKSINNGAKYIAAGYISKGQYTSYLTKFNVNPGSSYSVYTHQYMTNVRGAYYESARTYSAYSNNNLLSQPLVFTIPIFNNMPSVTILPGGTETPPGSSITTDIAFDEDLVAKGFTETYIARLRELHTLYPNWTFESLRTNLDWNSVVSAEQPNSYIDGNITAYRAANNGNCNDPSSPYCLKEGANWYLANVATTAYFLDPRNFLDSHHIFMFLKLSYSAVETEAVLSSMLQNTFMSGTSSLDNKTYAKLFNEAGAEHNVSPIFLVSKVIQEVGVNGSAATTGAAFTYNDTQYSGIYNFYNIGAYSNVYDGLFWASVGITNTTTSSEESTYLSQFGLTKRSTYITGIPIGTTVSYVKGKAGSLTISITNSSGTELNSTATISTGTKVNISDESNTYDYTAVLYGDISGDGDINAVDLLYLRKHLLGTQTLTGANYEAAKIAKNSTLNAVDLLYLRRYLLDSNTYKITQ